MPPYVVVLAAYSKHRREDHQPLRPEFARRLVGYLLTRPAGFPIWGELADPVGLIRRDLVRAGVPAVDDQGRHADFHSLRHTYVCRLVRGGPHLNECQSLARHASITTTIDYYDCLRLHDTSRALGL